MILIIVCSLVLLVRLAFRSIVVLYDRINVHPVTRFGFRGTLVYADDKPDAKVFVNHRFELSARPDFIFKVGFNKYVGVEYKNRRSGARTSDVAQSLATVVAVRSQFNIQGYYVVTNGTVRYEACPESTIAIYRKIAKLHKTAKRIKYLNKRPAIHKTNKCRTCGYRDNCFGN
ncbi:Dna2/Cas4 domain-containing protein [Vibrio mediterranei]